MIKKATITKTTILFISSESYKLMILLYLQQM